MKVLGLITEYNPFHNGHLYHLEKSKEVSGCDTVVCIMSGNFIQRGLPALVNKWARTEMALANHVDLVIELPVYYAVSSAEFFAFGAIKLLDSLGVVDSVCFGSECGEVEILNMVAKVLVEEPEDYRYLLGNHLRQGISFPTARSLALQNYFNRSNKNDSALIKLVVNQPNNILGIEYIKALYKLKSKIQPATIKRYTADYNSIKLFGNIASATAIRKILKSDNLDIINGVVPPPSYEILDREFREGRGPVFADSFESILLSTIRKMNVSHLKNITDISEGIENRIKKAAQNSGSFHDLLVKIKTKRYTLTRLQRILIHILLGLSKDFFNSFHSIGGPPYIRVLGFSSKGKELLSKIKSSSLPLVTTPSDFLRTCSPFQKEMLEADILASDIYSLGYPVPSQRIGGQDFYQRILSI